MSAAEDTEAGPPPYVLPEWIEFQLRRERQEFVDLMVFAQVCAQEAISDREKEKARGDTLMADFHDFRVKRFFGIAMIMELLYVEESFGGAPRKDYFAAIQKRWEKGKGPPGGWGAHRRAAEKAA